MGNPRPETDTRTPWLVEEAAALPACLRGPPARSHSPSVVQVAPHCPELHATQHTKADRHCCIFFPDVPPVESLAHGGACPASELTCPACPQGQFKCPSGGCVSNVRDCTANVYIRGAPPKRFFKCTLAAESARAVRGRLPGECDANRCTGIEFCHLHEAFEYACWGTSHRLRTRAFVPPPIPTSPPTMPAPSHRSLQSERPRWRTRASASAAWLRISAATAPSSCRTTRARVAAG